MSTYTESTGFEIKEIDLATGYNPTTNNGSTIYTCPEGKFAVITQLTGRFDLSSGQGWIQIDKMDYGDNLQQLSEHATGTIGGTKGWQCFSNLLTYNGNVFSFDANLVTTPATFHAERFLVPGERIRVRHQSFSRTVYWRVRIEEFTPQV